MTLIFKIMKRELDDSKNTQTLKDLLDTKDFIEHISVDCTVFGFHKNNLKVLLLKYHDLNMWALPGGFVFNNENIDDAAARVLYERTHLQDIFLDQFHTFGKIDRTENNVHQILFKNKGITLPKNHWIFQRYITIAYCSLVDYTLANTFPDSINEECGWFYVNQLPKMAFDHEKIIKRGLRHLRKNLDTQLVAYNLLPEKFTMNDLQNLYETVLGKKLRQNNFQKKMLSLNTLERLEKYYDGSANKAPYLYKYKENLEEYLNDD